MKLVIQIPCFNEESHLGETVRDLPRSIGGVDEIELLVVDDGSSDNTAEVARSLGATVISVSTHRGLAHAFMVGMDAGLSRGADVIVNTDADDEYRAEDIAKLVEPILDGHADMVIGARPIREIHAFSPTKKLLQLVGSWVVRKISATEVSDATSGFRALSREAALQVNVLSRYTYTLESIVQTARTRGLRVTSVPIRVNETTRPSRLVRSNWSYLWRTGSDLLRILVVYRPFRSFMLPALVLFAIATTLALRFVYYLFESGGAGHIQSLLLAAILYGSAES